jgi:hypothetical protein
MVQHLFNNFQVLFGFSKKARNCIGYPGEKRGIESNPPPAFYFSLLFFIFFSL